MPAIPRRDNCIVCGEAKGEDRRRVATCSEACSVEWNRAKSTEKKRRAQEARSEVRCQVCESMFRPYKPTSRTCSRRCANTLVSRETAEQRSEKQRGRGEGKTYRKLMGKHEHRAVMERKLGRELLPTEVVHHVDGNKSNNDPSNLVVLSSQSEHCAGHATKNRTCSADGCSEKHFARGMCRAHYRQSHKEVLPKCPVAYSCTKTA